MSKTYVYTYDNAGNRTSKKTYAYSEMPLGTELESQTYTYSASGWGDQLTSGGIVYDTVGNPIFAEGYFLVWNGRELMQRKTADTVVTSYEYNADGIRTSKTVNGVEHIYTLSGTQIISEAWGTNLLIYLYDESGSPIGMQYRNNAYAVNTFNTFFFEKNLQGDIIAVYNENGVKVLSYTYDAWGNHTTTWHYSIGTNIVAEYNPFRYRGYYYDTETGWYYLQSRYYNPAWGRFLNADAYVNGNKDLIGFNMYAYCSNNPVMYVDYTGNYLSVSCHGKDEAGLLGMVNIGWGGVCGGIVAGTAGYNIYTNVKEDIENYDKYNESEAKVLQSHYFSSYKGVLVLRIPGKRSGSLGIIFLTHGSNTLDNSEDIVRHEYGHTKQLERLGLMKYMLCIGLPSWQEWGSKDYYDKPWEVTADIYGGVQSREASIRDRADAFYYLWLSEQVGPFAWRTID